MTKGLECIGEVPIEGWRPIEVMMDDRLPVCLQWPTSFSDKEVATKVVEAMRGSPDAAVWDTEIVWATEGGDRMGSIDEYLQSNDAYPQSERFRDDGLLFRLNCGPSEGEGFTVIMYRDERQPLLQGNFSLENGDLANAIVESTIVPEGRGKTAEIGELALAYS